MSFSILASLRSRPTLSASDEALLDMSTQQPTIEDRKLDAQILDVATRFKHSGLLFFLGKRTVLSTRRKAGNIDHVLQRWYGDFDELEVNHAYIQWLFPTFTASLYNDDAPVLSAQEAALFRRCPTASRNFIEAYEMMLHFYGMKLLDYRTGKLGRSEDNRQEDCYANLIYSTHNHLRICRLLSSLSVLGFRKYAVQLLGFLHKEIFVAPAPLSRLQGRSWGMFATYNDVTTSAFRQYAGVGPDAVRESSILFAIDPRFVSSGGDEKVDDVGAVEVAEATEGVEAAEATEAVEAAEAVDEDISMNLGADAAGAGEAAVVAAAAEAAEVAAAAEAAEVAAAAEAAEAAALAEAAEALERTELAEAAVVAEQAQTHVTEESAPAPTPGLPEFPPDMPENPPNAYQPS